MKFLHRQPSSFEDITRNFEQLETIFTGLNAVRFGTGTVVWDGVNAFTNQPTVTHGLPKVPAVVHVSANWDLYDFAVGAFNVTATTFQVQGNRMGLAAPPAGSSTFYWLAIG